MSGLGRQMTGGKAADGRQENDFYPTRDIAVTRALTGAWRPRSTTIWECACGEGDMALELERGYPGVEIVATDLIDRGFGEAPVDFLQERRRRADCIITNGPFDRAEEFITHAFALGVTEMAFLLKPTFWNTAGRYRLWRRHTPAYEFKLTWRPDFLGKGNPTMDMNWYVWDAQISAACLDGFAFTKPLAKPGGLL